MPRPARRTFLALLLLLLPLATQACIAHTLAHAHTVSPAAPLPRVLLPPLRFAPPQGTYRRLFSWGRDRYGSMGVGGRATVLGAATPAYSCTPTQVTALNWPVLEPLGAR
jgi:hypothetical protein